MKSQYTAFKCAETECGDTSDFDYGTGWADVTSVCVDQVCDHTCAAGTFVYPATQSTCTDGVLSPVSGTEFSCTETPCGPLIDHITINVDVTKGRYTIFCAIFAKRNHMIIIILN